MVGFGTVRSIAAAAMVLTGASAFAGTISLTSSSPTFQVGDTAVFQVVDSLPMDACDLSTLSCAANFAFSYDPTLLRYVSAASTSPDFLVVGQPELPADPVPNGSFEAILVFTPDVAPVGSTALIEIRFTALAPVSLTSVSLSVPPGGVYGTIQDPGITASANIGITAVPEPASWLLSLAGLGVVAGAAARRRAAAGA